MILGLLAVARIWWCHAFYFTALLIVFVPLPVGLTIAGFAGAGVGGFLGYKLFGHVSSGKSLAQSLGRCPGKGYQIA